MERETRGPAGKDAGASRTTRGRSGRWRGWMPSGPPPRQRRCARLRGRRMTAIRGRDTCALLAGRCTSFGLLVRRDPAQTYPSTVPRATDDRNLAIAQSTGGLADATYMQVYVNYPLLIGFRAFFALIGREPPSFSGRGLAAARPAPRRPPRRGRRRSPAAARMALRLPDRRAPRGHIRAAPRSRDGRR